MYITAAAIGRILLPRMLVSVEIVSGYEVMNARSVHQLPEAVCTNDNFFLSAYIVYSCTHIFLLFFCTDV